jgi:hypothetical protein
VELYGTSVEYYGTFVELYAGSVELYGNPIEHYGTSVEYYRTFVELYGSFVEHPKPGKNPHKILSKEYIYGWRLHSPSGRGILGMDKDTFGVCNPQSNGF